MIDGITRAILYVLRAIHKQRERIFGYFESPSNRKHFHLIMLIKAISSLTI